MFTKIREAVTTLGLGHPPQVLTEIARFVQKIPRIVYKLWTKVRWVPPSFHNAMVDHYEERLKTAHEHEGVVQQKYVKIMQEAEDLRQQVWTLERRLRRETEADFVLLALQTLMDIARQQPLAPGTRDQLSELRERAMRGREAHH